VEPERDAACCTDRDAVARPPRAQRRLRCRLRKVHARLDDLIAACDHLLDAGPTILLAAVVVGVGVDYLT